jgi:hypothetical protein
MADDLELRTPQDASRISLSEDWEIRYWTKKFQVSEAELREAVAAVGNSSAAVARWFEKE